MKSIPFIAALVIAAACSKPTESKIAFKEAQQGGGQNGPSSPPAVTTGSIYSTVIADTFRIFVAKPTGYDTDASRSYPLIVVLDANAYLEPLVAEMKLGELTQGLPASIIVGIGYRNFEIMDSLRNRDYTYPVAPPQDGFSVSGGAENFKKFIDDELLPGLAKEFRITKDESTLLGHSLGGYFVLYYFFDSLEKGVFNMHHFVAASPSLSYANNYIVKRKKTVGVLRNPMPVSVYVSMGTLEQDPNQKESQLKLLSGQFDAAPFTPVRYRFVQYGNFNHMDAAMPGFIKGLIFRFELLE